MQDMKILKLLFYLFVIFCFGYALVFLYFWFKKENFDLKNFDLNSFFNKFRQMPLDISPNSQKGSIENKSRSLQKSKKVNEGLTSGILTKRQMQILEFLKQFGDKSVGMSLISRKFKEVSPRTLRRDLQALSDNGYVEVLGATKNREYKLK